MDGGFNLMMKLFWNLIEVVFTQHCECSKGRGIVHF